MSIDLFLFCIAATLITFSLICVFAVSNPGYPKRSYGAENWGDYSTSQSKNVELVHTGTKLAAVTDEVQGVG
jgi:hypothetical protein